VPPLKQTDAGLYVTAAEADRLKNSHADQVVLIDIRSRVEVLYAGRPEDVDIHVPYREPALSPRWSASGDRLVMQRNPAFVSEVRAALARLGRPDDSTILLLCRSGTVSAIAADALTAAGLRNVFTIVDGFEGDLAASGRRDVNGWKNVGAHWTSGTSDALSLAAPR
jgi:rhodanese-related sulfurtransferase